MERIAIQAGKSTVGLRTPGECLCAAVSSIDKKKMCADTRKLVVVVVQVVVVLLLLLLLVLFNRYVLCDVYRVLNILNITFVCNYCYDCVNIMGMWNIVCKKLQCIKLSFNFVGNIYGKQFLTILKSCPSFSLSLCSHHPHGKRCLLTPESHMC